MLNKLLETREDFSTMALRITLGLVIFPHGAQKLFGWFGGYGFAGTMHHFTENMGIPYIFALLAILAESFGALGLIVGLGTRIAALGVGATIGVAAFIGHVQHGFFMNWFGKQAGEGSMEARVKGQKRPLADGQLFLHELCVLPVFQLVLLLPGRR